MVPVARRPASGDVCPRLVHGMHCEYCHLNLKGVERCSVCKTQMCQARRMILESRCFARFCWSTNIYIETKRQYGELHVSRRRRADCRYCVLMHHDEDSVCGCCGSGVCQAERIQVEIDCAWQVCKKKIDGGVHDEEKHSSQDHHVLLLATQFAATGKQLTIGMQQVAYLILPDSPTPFWSRQPYGTSKRRIEVKYYTL